MPETNERLITHVAEIVAAHVANNAVASTDLPALIEAVHHALATLGEPAPAPIAEHVPAVSARKSLARPDVIISMVDGKPYKTLKRHLTGQGLTPDEYRKRYNLRADYPMVAPAVAERRREIAKQIGLGQKRRTAAAETSETSQTSQTSQTSVAAKPAKKQRKTLSAAFAEARKHLGN